MGRGRRTRGATRLPIVAVACLGLFFASYGLRFHVADKVIPLRVADAQVGHAEVLVFFQESRADRILPVQKLFRVLDHSDEPVVIARPSHAHQIGPDLVAVADSVAGEAIASKEVLATIEIFERPTVGRALRFGRIQMPVIVQKVTDHARLE